MTTSPQTDLELLEIEVEVTGPLPSDVKVYVVDPITGYRSLLDGVVGVQFSANPGEVNLLTLEVHPALCKISGVSAALQPQSPPE